MLNELTAIRRLIQEGDREPIDLTLGGLLVQRERWLKEREANEWADVADTPIDRTTMSEQLLGGWLGGKMKRDKKGGER